MKQEGILENYSKFSKVDNIFGYPKNQFHYPRPKISVLADREPKQELNSSLIIRDCKNVTEPIDITRDQ